LLIPQEGIDYAAHVADSVADILVDAKHRLAEEYHSEAYERVNYAYAAVFDELCYMGLTAKR
jgi:hypothetical protein